MFENYQPVHDKTHDLFEQTGSYYKCSGKCVKIIDVKEYIS